MGKKPSSVRVDRVKKVWACLIRNLRDERGLTLREVARSAGVSVAAVNRAERGFDPMLTTAEKLSRYFGIPISELWPKRLPH